MKNIILSKTKEEKPFNKFITPSEDASDHINHDAELSATGDPDDWGPFVSNQNRGFVHANRLASNCLATLVVSTCQDFSLVWKTNIKILLSFPVSSS